MGVAVCSGAEGPFTYGKKRGVQFERSLREGCHLPREGEGTLGQDIKILLAIEMAENCLFIYLNTLIEQLLYAKLDHGIP